MAGENDALAWQAVGRLDAKDTGFCTATLIAPDQVLTAAHCVYDRKTRKRIAAHDMRFRAGLRNGREAAARDVVQVEPHPGYDPKGQLTADNIRYDVALLRLARPIPTSELDPFALHDRKVSGGSVSVVSYGRDREKIPSRQDVCQVVGTQQDVMIMDCDVTFGSSGSPVFRPDPLGRGQIVSVISGMGYIHGKQMALGMTLPDVVGQLRHQMWANKAKPVAKLNRIKVGGDGDQSSSNGAKFVRP
ncbi:MAG: trypsin-like serine protease [Pseudomonadota bacterium]